MTDQTHDATLDALAFVLATLRSDWEGRTVVALHCDPTELVDALVALVLGTMAMHVGPHQVEDVLKRRLADAARRAGGDQ